MLYLENNGTHVLELNNQTNLLLISIKTYNIYIIPVLDKRKIQMLFNAIEQYKIINFFQKSKNLKNGY